MSRALLGRAHCLMRREMNRGGRGEEPALFVGCKVHKPHVDLAELSAEENCLVRALPFSSFHGHRIIITN